MVFPNALLSCPTTKIGCGSVPHFSQKFAFSSDWNPQVGEEIARLSGSVTSD